MRSRSQGFTLLEVVVALTILIALVGLLLPILGQSKREAQAAAIVSTISGLRRACERYYLDTQTLPIKGNEKSAPFSDDLFTEPGGDLPGWKGPYLLEPLRFDSQGWSSEIIDKVADPPPKSPTPSRRLGSPSPAKDPP